MVLAERASQVTAIAPHGQNAAPGHESPQRLFLDGVERQGGDPPVIGGCHLAACADSGAMKRSQRQVANDEQINEDDMLEQVLRTYRILMNRAVKGVYIYACDDALNKYLQQFFDGK